MTSFKISYVEAFKDKLAPPSLGNVKTYKVMGQPLDARRHAIIGADPVFLGHIQKTNPRRQVEWAAYVPDPYLYGMHPHAYIWVGSFPTRYSATEVLIHRKLQKQYGIALRKKKLLNDADRERAIEMFVAAGCASHSANAQVLPYLVEYCEIYDIPYTIQAEPVLGYYIQAQIPSA